MIYPTEYVLGYRVYSGPLDQIALDGKHVIINTINAYSYVVAKNDPEFKQALQHSHILLPDGSPIVWASRFAGNGKIKHKIAGHDIFCHLMDILNKNNGSCFFLGSSEKTLDKIRNNIQTDYPNVKVQAYSPPFKKTFSMEDNLAMLEIINKSSPDVLFVGMTAPKQEKWVDAHANILNAGIICAIGAVFDFYAGTIKRPGKIWIKIGLEWFIRLLKEPKRLWKRYLIYSPIFFIDLFLCIIRIKKFD
ncbi:MAG TPA: WecB/TagA/CpsF family glycosyltransferase [Bacteroidales bacterium]